MITVWSEELYRDVSRPITSLMTSGSKSRTFEETNEQHLQLLLREETNIKITIT